MIFPGNEGMTGYSFLFSTFNPFQSYLFFYRFKSRVLASPMKTAGAAAPSNLMSNLKSFLPAKPVVHKPTSEEIQQKKEEELVRKLFSSKFHINPS